MQGSIPVTSNGRILASPNAKRVAKEKGIDLKTLTGTGPGKNHIRRCIEAPKPEVQAPPGTTNRKGISETTAQPSVPFAARKLQNSSA
ncbi:MAG: hypothetical protein CM15mP49_33440 [Actinomycetota bacterium]|nr:MAG: hypothetical protein CM15mP49_33440 [Actinomycetota bacterium]